MFLDGSIYPGIYDLLFTLGVHGDYTGFFYAAYAVYLSARQPERLLLVTKWLYPEVAKHYGTTWHCVERDIRTVIDVVWRKNRSCLESLAGRPLFQKPQAKQFLSILSSHCPPSAA